MLGAGAGADDVHHVDVLIIGAGPAGMTLANLLGLYGVQVLLVEREATLIDYPRGVGLDDESMRVFQTAGVVEDILPHTAPDQWLRFYSESGKCLVSMEPRGRELGWPKRIQFIQPMTDRMLLAALKRFPHIEALFSHELKELTEDGDGMLARIDRPGDRTLAVKAKYVVGCDGGRSTVRKLLDIPFDGVTDSTRWIVMDLKNDPIGQPNSQLHCVFNRPYASLCLPHGMRRLEFMIAPHEKDEDFLSPEGIRRLLALVMPAPDKAEVIRTRVYTHHARLAQKFRKGRAFIAGDAAHLMPVWQGQGFNSGVRDVNNLSWKLVLVLRGLADDGLLDTYELERRPHAGATIRLSHNVGRVFAPSRRWIASLRNAVVSILNLIPPMRDYLLQMRFKPMPRYAEGAVFHQKVAGQIEKSSSVGRLLPQPQVTTADGRTVLLDDAIGVGFVILSWNMDPCRYMDVETRDLWDRLGARYVIVRPPRQLASGIRAANEPAVIEIGDANRTLQEWFTHSSGTIVILRPDRFVAALANPQTISDVTRALSAALCADVTRPPAKATAEPGAEFLKAG